MITEVSKVCSLLEDRLISALITTGPICLHFTICNSAICLNYNTNSERFLGTTSMMFVRAKSVVNFDTILCIHGRDQGKWEGGRLSFENIQSQ
jgi:hypothetical protein